ncbi:hypothetical protein B0T25DRAFT_541069 [Lasiosphaeria hispida]|uniref:Uncharacterized protein n=1 Tax=Lasiosphaeria hispida TaxID=260671 RepID=A0AAJ0HNJ3_9PEZI|nr:hypothetical protein B0T25DRAFT_541069 [Lasiosphaeria hispida]
MEDEEYYHMMLDDLERLERVHHHPEFLPGPSWQQRNTAKDTATITNMQKHTSGPWLSGLRVAVTGTVKASVDLLMGSIVEGRSRMSTA